VVAFARFAKQHEVIAAAHSRLAFAALLPASPGSLFSAVEAAAFGNVDFAADDGFDVALARLMEEICSREQVPMVGHGHRWHFLARCLVEQFRGFACSVEQAEIRMHVEMDELRLAHGPQF
jgi:hypothetical protein